MAAHGTSVYRHSGVHAERSSGVKVDKESWQAAREYLQLSKICPPLPYKPETSHRSSSAPKRRTMHEAPRRKSPEADIDKIFQSTIKPIHLPVSPVRPIRRTPDKKIPTPYNRPDVAQVPKSFLEEYVPKPYRKPDTIASLPVKTTTTIVLSPKKKMLEQQPYRLSANEQQRSIQLIDRHLACLNTMKLTHMRILADIDLEIAVGRRERLKVQSPANTY